MRAYLAELIGTFILVFVGCATILTGGSRLEIALAFGLALMVVVYATGRISGAHVNPAVTIARLVTRNIKFKDAAGYIIAQIAGATLAAFALSIFLGDVTGSVNRLGNGISLEYGIMIEAILTFILVFAIYALIDNSAEHIGLVLGGVLASVHIAAIPLTGASLNPARTLGPALASGMWVNHAVYWVGPIAGAVVAALVYKNIFMKKKR